MSKRLLLTDVELGGIRTDVRVKAGIVTDVGSLGRQSGELQLAGAGRSLLAGLHDHHCHVLATAAALDSVDCSSPLITNTSDLAAALSSAKTVNGWIRGVGYDELVAGHLDALALDRLSPAIPTRIQHRSGAMWVVNTPGLESLHLDDFELAGIERDDSGRPTGRLWRLDDWLHEQLGSINTDVARVSSMLAEQGVTGVTDASPGLSTDAVQTLIDGGFRQRLVSLGEPHDQALLGPKKIVLPDHQLPSLAELRRKIAAARPRAVAIHCVTRAALALTLAVLREIGSWTGDRIEHAAVCPPELTQCMSALGLAVVTQPSMITRRGDAYARLVDADDVPYLWPFASLVAAGVPVGCSSDAPYGDANPWESVAAAVGRLSASGRALAPAERVDAITALRGYLSAYDAPGGAPREIRPGVPADLCLLDRPLAAALAHPQDVQVVLTVVDGEAIHDTTGRYA